jgi:hypothetical protein
MYDDIWCQINDDDDDDDDGISKRVTPANS